MRKVIAAEYLTLDGVMENPAWTGPYWNDELAQLQHELLFASDALLLGRVTYQGFAAAWPAMTEDGEFADRMNGLPKHVASRTLTTPAWNAQFIEGDVAEAVAQLKQQSGGHLLIYGSGQLAEYLRRHQLIDEYRLMVFPVVLGSGKRLFQEGPSDFKLTNTVTTSADVVVLTYERA